MDGGADLTHECGGGDVVALDVADDRSGGGVAQADEVVEVAADIHAMGGGQVAGGHGDAGDGGEGAWEEGLLEAVGEVVFGVVEAGAV